MTRVERARPRPAHARPAPARARRALLALAVALAVVAPSVGRAGWLDRFGIGSSDARGYSLEDLRAELSHFAQRATVVIGGTADRITERSPVRAVRRRALLWRVRMVPIFRSIALQSDPLESFADSLVTTTAMLEYLSDGEGREAFEELQPLAVEAAQQLLASLEEIGSRFLTPAQLARAREQAHQVSASQKISGPDFATGRVSTLLERRDAQGASSFGWLVEVPLSPFRALEGVGSGAAAIHEFNQTADRFSRVVEQIPQQLRWESELLLFDLEDRDTTVGTLAALQGLAESSRIASATLEQLRQDLQQALEGSGEPLTEVRRVLAQAQELAGPLERTAEHLELASASWAEMRQREPGEAPGRPFDVREWERAAAEVGRSAEALQRAMRELRTLGDTPELARLFGDADAAVLRARGSAEAVVDHLMGRALALLVAFFALLLLYRVLAARIDRSARR